MDSAIVLEQIKLGKSYQQKAQLLREQLEPLAKEVAWDLVSRLKQAWKELSPGFTGITGQRANKWFMQANQVMLDEDFSLFFSQYYCHDDETGLAWISLDQILTPEQREHYVAHEIELWNKEQLDQVKRCNEEAAAEIEELEARLEELRQKASQAVSHA